MGSFFGGLAASRAAEENLRRAKERKARVRELMSPILESSRILGVELMRAGHAVRARRAARKAVRRVRLSAIPQPQRADNLRIL